MNEEEKKELNTEVEDTTSQDQAPLEEKTEESSEQEGEPVEKTEDDSDKPVIDYEAELARLHKEKDQYKEGLLGLKKKLKEKKYKVEDDEDSSEEEHEEDTEDIKEKILQEAKKDLEAFKLQMREDVVDESLESISSNESERKLIRYHYENTLQRSGYDKKSIYRDLKRAQLLANESRLEKENSELKESLKSKNTLSTTSMGASQKSRGQSWSKFTAEEKALMDKFGITPADIEKNRSK